MFGTPPPPVPESKRPIMREVALTFRRVLRARQAAGDTPPQWHAAATNAALAAYMRLDPDAPEHKGEASGVANLMIANAINADTEWFWHGPDV
jgi:hypothetical protein